MSREDIVAIGSRLLAVYLVFRVLEMAIASQPLFFVDDGPALWRVGFVAIMAALIGVCALLWWFPLTIARKLLPVMREPRSEEAIGTGTALSLALTIIGVWLFANGLVSAVFWAMLLHRVAMEEFAVQIPPRQYAEIASTAARLVVGAWLVLGNAGVRRLVERLRYAGS